MIDFIQAIKFGCKDTINFGYLQLEKEYHPDIEVYTLDGCKSMKLIYNRAADYIRVSGSVAYFMQGHNFVCSKTTFREGIDYISKAINVDLWHSIVEIFEYGVIMEVPMKPCEYISHHREGKGQQMNYNLKNKGRYISFDDNECNRKMYDAGRNIQHKQGTKMKEIIRNAGWDPTKNYLKWECHYLKPESLVAGRRIYLKDLLNPDMDKLFRNNVYDQYKTIIPLKSIDMEKARKSKLHTSEILAIALVEKCIGDGNDINQIKKMLYSRINSIEGLTKSDKDARKGQIRTLLGKLDIIENSQWDISETLYKALALD